MRTMILGPAIASALVGGASAQQRIAPEKWITAADYPASAAEHDDEGSVRMTYTVTAEGRAERCRVEFATAPRKLAELSCRLVEQRARYIPRYIKSGEAISGRDLLVIRWHSAPTAIDIPASGDFGGAIPAGSPNEWATDREYPYKLLKGDADVPMAWTIGSDGRLAECSFPAQGVDPKVGNHTCQLFGLRARFTMPLDEKGEPIATRAKTRFYWRKAKY